MGIVGLLAYLLSGLLGCSGRAHNPTEPSAFTQLGCLDAIPSWSPDGRSIAYLHEPRSASDTERIAITDTLGSMLLSVLEIHPGVSPQLAWSPDGTRIAFYEGGICTVDITDHLVRRWTGPYVSGPAWSPNGRFLVYMINGRESNQPDSTAGLHVIDTQGGTQRALLHSDTLATYGDCPVWSPDGKNIAFMSDEGPSAGNVCVVGLDDGRFRQVTRLNGYCADLQWSSEGQSVYFHFTPAPASYGDPRVTTSYLVNFDGSGLRQLGANLGDPRVHFWFQFALRRGDDLVAFTGPDSSGKGGVIWTMNLDGSHRRQITTP